MNAWWRWALLIAIDVAMVVALVQVWRSESDRATSVPIATADPDGDVRATPRTPLPTPSTDPLQERLAKLRAGDDYLELAEVERARLAEFHHATLGRLGWMNEQGQRIGFLNPKEMWQQIALPARDDLLLAGREYREPVYGEPVASTLILLPPVGDYQLLAVNGVFERGQQLPVLKSYFYLVQMPEYAIGKVIAHRDPIETPLSDYDSWEAVATRTRPLGRAWAEEVILGGLDSNLHHGEHTAPSAVPLVG